MITNEVVNFILNPAGVDEPGVVSGFAIESIAPNPSTGAFEVRLRTDSVGAITVDVHDSGGRLVRHLNVAGAGGRARLLALWDGTTESGRPAGAGVYYLRAKQSGGREQHATGRVVIVR